MGMVTLAEVLVTQQLANRRTRAADFQAENTVLNDMARAMSDSPSAVMQQLVESALQLCLAGSSGVSTLFEDADGGGFDWTALSGRFAPFVGGRAPRQHSPCGVCLQLDAPQLFRHPERYFEWMQAANIPVFEGLVVPLYTQERSHYGTIWVMKHEADQGFDNEDVRVMRALGDLMSTALRMVGWFDGRDHAAGK